MRSLRNSAALALTVAALMLPSQASAQKIGDRRIVVGSLGPTCEIYRYITIDVQGHKRLMWYGLANLPSEVTSACANAVNLPQYFASLPVETLDPVESIVSAIREGRAAMSRPSDFTHACGSNGLVYDVFADGRTRQHPQTLRYPNRRCRPNPYANPYTGRVVEVIPSAGGE